MNNKLGVQIAIFLTLFLFIFTAVSYSVYSVPPITQDVIVVDVNGNGDYTSIKEAIRNADTTDIIMIRKGVYDEFELNIGNKIEIIGEDPIYTIINCSGNRGFSLGSSYVEISNIQIINVRDYAIATASQSVGCTISNCIIYTLYGGIGIELSSSYNMVSDCDIYGYDKNEQGIKILGNFNIVKNCNINSFGNGILIILGASNNNLLNCNIFNNEVAIDIRLNSNNNFVTGCNVYSNLEGIRIWQNSNNNLVYLSNFWKNDKTASDEGNNSWDNGEIGNYWDIYQGEDSDDDGIGDTPYTISRGKEDRYPIINMILPDEITSPGSVKHVSSSFDNTPSFTWNPSLYINGTKGYYVKIDNNPETYIGDTTSWTSPDTILDGVHTFYVRAVGTDDTTSGYANVEFSIDITFIDTDSDGWSDEEEQQYGTDPNDPDNYPLDIDDDRIPNTIDTDDDNDGYSDSMELSYRTSIIDPESYPTDTDKDDVPDDDSPDGKYTGDIDDDDDYLLDTVEASLGSDPKDGSDAEKIYIIGKPYYLVDTSQNGIYNILYEKTSDTTTAVEKQNSNYLIDENGDGAWDYVYNTIDGSISPYEEQIILPLPIWILIAVAIVITASIIILYYFKNKPRKYRIFRKPSMISISDKETAERMSKTKALLENIKKDVEVYLEQLHQLEDIVEYRGLEEEMEEITKPSEDLESKLADVNEIEEQVDELLSTLEKKDK